MAWRKREDPFPGPLREFIESEWPPVPGECLTHYGCHGAGYAADCCPRPGEYCGQLCYESLERDFADRPEMLERAKLSDAYERFHRARLSWLGEDHPLWFEEFLNASGVRHAMRYGEGPGR